MAKETVCIPKSEYKRLKKLERVDHETLFSIAKSLYEIEQGKIERIL
ncbi:MAG: hypothetical protein KAI43_07300 [Candidatus Aureabacteria bacterium]|nr:hypothetical protein [Candidatus Auribacterota bacterium]